MQTIFGLFSLENAESAAADLEQRLGQDQINLLAPDSVKARLSTSRAQPAVPGAADAPVAAPTLAHLIGRKRPVFLGEAGSLYAINELAAHIIDMAQSRAPTKTRGSLKVALEEFGISSHYAEAYATGVQHGYVLLFAQTPEDESLDLSEGFGAHGGRDVFIFQRMD